MNEKFKHMRFVLVILVILFTQNRGYCQVRLSMDSVSISYVVDSIRAYYIGNSLVTNPINPNKPVDLVDEDLQQGPYLCGYITIHNEGKDAIALTYSDVWNNSYYQFFANNKIYNIQILHFHYFRSDLVMIPGGGKYTLGAGTWLFLGTDLYKSAYFPGSEYSREVIEALPTLQFVLKYGEETYKSCGIKKVIYVPRDDE